jgi:restriction system protein
MSALQAAEQVLAEAGEPLDARTITERMLKQQLWTTNGATPDATVNSQIATDIKNLRSSSRFQRTNRGIFALRAWGLPEYIGTSHDDISEYIHPAPPSSISGTRSFTDAAQDVLERYGHRKPMHYREITRKALELGLLDTQGKTPEATMYAQILSEIARQGWRGEVPRFVKHGKGRVSLAHWSEKPDDLVDLIQKHNHNIRKQLHDSLYKISLQSLRNWLANYLWQSVSRKLL